MVGSFQLKPRVRRVSLAFMGDDWKDGCINFRYMGLDDSRRQQEREIQLTKGDGYAALDLMQDTLADMFIDGKALSSKEELVDLTKDDLSKFDLEAIGHLYERVLGIPDPKASKS